MKTNQKLILQIIFILVVMLINFALVMWIWNGILIKKFPNANIQKLTYTDAILITFFIAILFKSNYNIKN